MDKPKPCPFCGREEADLTRIRCDQNYVRCPNCGAAVLGEFDEDLTVKQAVKLWNRRVNDG